MDVTLSRHSRFLFDNLGPTCRWGVCNDLTGYSLGITEGLFNVLQALQADELTAIGPSFLPSNIYDTLCASNILVPESRDDRQFFSDWRLCIPKQNGNIWVRSPVSRLVAFDRSTRQFAQSRSELPRPTIVDLTALQSLALEMASNELTVNKAISTAGDEIWNEIEYLSGGQYQMLHLKPPTSVGGHVTLPHNRVNSSLQGSRLAGLSWTSQATEMDDVAWRFDWIEPTLAHAFRRNNAMLSNRAYATQIIDKLIHLSEQKSVRILEVGGGTGSLAKCALETCEAISTYTMIDISPKLHQQQAHMISEFRNANACLGNAVEGVPGGPYDIVLLNEVLADIYSNPDDLGCGRFSQLITSITKALSPTGLIAMVEYGSVSGEPLSILRHLDHIEIPVDFSALVVESKVLGFTAHVEQLAEFISADLTIPLLDGEQDRILLLNNLLEDAGLESIPYAVCDMQDVQRISDRLLPVCIPHLTLSPAADAAHYGPAWQNFYIAVLRRNS